MLTVVNNIWQNFIGIDNVDLNDCEKFIDYK